MGSRRFSYALTSGLISATIFGTVGYLFGRKADELSERAETDSLTALYNARGFESRLYAEIARTGRYHSPLSLLLIDLDRLKAINDRHGHYAGQTALREVAAAIRTELRASDVAARWGGDEFAVIAPGTDRAGAVLLAERLARGVKVLAVGGVEGGTSGPGLRAGYDAVGNARYTPIEPKNLLARATTALRAAKGQGGPNWIQGYTLTP